MNVATTKNRARLYDRNFVRFGRFFENADGKTARNFARREDRRSNSRFQRMIRISGFEEGTCSFQQIVTSTWQRSNEEIKGRRNRQEDLESPHDLPLFFFFFCLLVRGKKKEKEKESSGARLDLRWWTATYSKCERMQISSLMSGIFKEAERWMEHAAGTGQYDDICIWYIIQSTFLPPTMAACAAHKPPCRSHEIRLPGKSLFFPLRLRLLSLFGFISSVSKLRSLHDEHPAIASSIDTSIIIRGT